MHKKKQFRLYDIYRNISLDKQSNIQGILDYTVEVDNTFKQIYVSVTFYNYEMFENCITIDTDAEAKLKEFVKRVNKRLKTRRLKILKSLARRLKIDKN